MVQDYETCNKTKNSRHKLYRRLQPLQTLERPWQSISWDLIVKLLLFREPVIDIQYNSILIIIDRYSKYNYFVPYKESHTVKELTYTFQRVITNTHRLPEEIINDRRLIFVSKFW